jgi:hypothetical protein
MKKEELGLFLIIYISQKGKNFEFSFKILSLELVEITHKDAAIREGIQDTGLPFKIILEVIYMEISGCRSRCPRRVCELLVQG